MDFEDHYSGHAESYARFRPRYPDELFAWLASLVPDRELAWDVGTGNGQVAAALANHVKNVVATDASSDQLARAVAAKGVTYRNEPADRVSLPDASADLITAGAAAHWFDLEGFYREVRRVGKPGAVVALFSYGPRDVADACAALFGDRAVHRLQDAILEGFWPERIRYVHDHYASLPFPFDELPSPPFSMTAEWNLEELLAFLETWSASQRYLQRRGRRATEEIRQELASAWGAPEQRYAFRFPLFVRAGRL